MIKGNWRDRILEKFPPHAASLTLVADPDRLLTEENIAQELQSRGFETILYEDSISFRFIYESKYRPQGNQSNIADLIVIVPCQFSELTSLPYDLLKISDRTLSFSLSQLFPNLSYPTLSHLERTLLDSLYDAISDYQPEPLGELETQDFILRHVFRIASEAIKTDSDLLHCLLRLHYTEQQLPDFLSDRLIKILRQKPQFQGFPLETIVPNRSAFLQFLQDNWQNFVRQHLLTRLPYASTVDASTSYGTSDTVSLPFGHKDVWAYMDNLFREGYLKPVSLQGLGFPNFKLKPDDWLRIGLRLDTRSDQKYRFKKLVELIQQTLPAVDAHHEEWVPVAYRWAELLVLWQQLYASGESELQVEFYALQERLDATFLHWVFQRYNTLHYQSPTRPAMLHHVPLFLARQIAPREKQKVALVVMDGLAIDQWLVIRNELTHQQPMWTFPYKHAVFALLPTLTSVSRQAIFAGKTPIGFATSIHTTSKEPALWKQFWLDQGFSAQQIGYQAGLSDEHHFAAVEELISHPAIRILGLVVDKVDRISHGKQSGTPSMHEQIRPWVQQGFLITLIRHLFDYGFQVFLTADHGSIEATGIGRPAEGAIADYRGERARIYPDVALRAKVKERFQTAIEWNSPMLPTDYLPLLAPARSAFVTEAEKVVAHGGISMEELMVPFVQIQQ